MSETAVYGGIQYELHWKAGRWFWTFQPLQGPRRFGRCSGEYEQALAVVMRAIEVSRLISAA